MTQASQHWWGLYSIPESGAGRWRVGALRLWVERRPSEWRVAHWSSDDPSDGACEVEVPCTGTSAPEDVVRERFGLRATGPEFRLTPVLPDRSVVSRPETPFHVLAEAEVQVYVSTPVWLEVAAGTPVRRLLELPLFRNSDTWFGSSTREGELCYANRTTLRQTYDDLPIRPHRALTPVRIHNRAESPLLVERLNVPVPYLSLYVGPDGALWTQSLVYDIAREGDTAEMHIDKGLPSEAPEAGLVGGPREIGSRNMLVRALGALIG